MGGHEKDATGLMATSSAALFDSTTASHRRPFTKELDETAYVDSQIRRLTEYQVIGRHLPSDANPTPKLYRMRIFADNDVVAKSRFWYFLSKLRKIKKTNGEIVTLNKIHEKRPQKVKNFGIWIRYDSRSGTHNMYKEYREMSRTDAVEALYQDMAARHRARFRSIHILKVVEIEKADDIRRPYIKQLLTKNLKFPLPHRIAKKANQKIFSANRPSTFY
ncbi:60S ribosomal protein L20-B [Cryomyces minteri]|uniref:60S ribosomal protein L20-B n=1 Tax=Cryomyces minteri TaxID=331657 RepID=A0A4U0XCC5_9PEZI|nr:60S ribosomal protein L20-B [Cryomyces minteri]